MNIFNKFICYFRTLCPYPTPFFFVEDCLCWSSKLYDLAIQHVGFLYGRMWVHLGS